MYDERETLSGWNTFKFHWLCTSISFLWEMLGGVLITQSQATMVTHHYVVAPDGLPCLYLACLNFLLCDRNVLRELTDGNRFWHWWQEWMKLLGVVNLQPQAGSQRTMRREPPSRPSVHFTRQTAPCAGVFYTARCVTKKKNDSPSCGAGQRLGSCAMWDLNLVHMYLPLTAITPLGTHQHKHEVTKTLEEAALFY